MKKPNRLPSQATIKAIYTYDDTNPCNPLIHIKTGIRVGKQSDSGYIIVYIKGKQYNLHRVVYKYHTGKNPDIVHHKDHDKLNNVIENLESVTNVENLMMKKNNTSGCPGVSFNKKLKRWQARIERKGVKHNLGTYLLKEEAINARKLAEEYYDAKN